jgi:hypothetical protein
MIVLAVAGCGRSPAAARPEPSPPLGAVTEMASGPDVCSLVSAERVGEIYGVSGVRSAAVTDPANWLGACDYTLPGFTVRVAAYAKDPTASAAEWVEGATYGKGTAIEGLGEAAAVARYDGSDPKLSDLTGYGHLAAVEDEVLLLINGPHEAVDRFEEVAREILPHLPSIY